MVGEIVTWNSSGGGGGGERGGEGEGEREGEREREGREGEFLDWNYDSGVFVVCFSIWKVRPALIAPLMQAESATGSVCVCVCTMPERLVYGLSCS